MSHDSRRLDLVALAKGRIAERLARKRSYRVILRRCDSPAAGRLDTILAESTQALGIRPAGKVLIKPCVVTANKKYIRHSYTDPEVAAAGIRIAWSSGAEAVTVGEAGGYGIPSRLFLHEAGYFRLRSLGVRIVDFSTERTVRVSLERAVCHRSLDIAQSLAEAEFLFWMPKLKYHVCCTITCALKLNIGITTHKERMLYHDDRLEDKIVDLLEVGYPDLVVVDGIEVGFGYESAPRNLHLGVVLVADDPVAADIVACRILGYEPIDCRHLMLAMERGYGPRHPGEVTVEGDITVDELRAVTVGFESAFQELQKLDIPIRFYGGVNPATGRICHGGCQAAVKGCLGTVDRRRPGSLLQARPGAIVTGVYRGDVSAGNGLLLYVGTCSQVQGKVQAGAVRRIRGCPLGTKHLLFFLPWHFRLPSPWRSLRDILLFLFYSADKAVRKCGSALIPGGVSRRHLKAGSFCRDREAKS